MAVKMSVFEHVVTLLALYLSLQCKVHAKVIDMDIFEEADNSESMEEGLRRGRSFYPEGAFLAGEMTPVWLAQEKEQGIMVYERLEPGIVKKAMDYFKSIDFEGYVLRYRRENNENITVIKTTRDPLAVLPIETDLVEEFKYPSVLVAMEYKNHLRTDHDADQKVIYKKILYALAYWNEVDIQLRPIRFPSVRIRVAGIVIARQKNVTPLRLNAEQPLGTGMYDSVMSRLQFWDRYRECNPDFAQGTFNVVATMTDSPVPIWTPQGYSTNSPNCDSTFPTRKPVKQLSALLVHDDQNFSGLDQTAEEMAHIMGCENVGQGSTGLSFTTNQLNLIKGVLSVASCWKTPNEGNPPGKPVETILPQDLYGPRND